MRELTHEEMESANGGFLPAISFALAIGGKAIGGGGVGTWAISSLSLVIASFEFAAWLDGGGL